MIQFSDGRSIEGRITASPGWELRVQDDAKLASLPLERIVEIRFAPEKETMEQDWFFPEAGQTRKEKSGEPYPVRFLRADVTTLSGERFAGHLYTTALYIESSNRTQKVVIPAKQRGKPGETFDELVYPVRIAFPGRAPGEAADATVIVTNVPGSVQEAVALTRGALIRERGRPPAGARQRFAGLRAAPFFTAVRTAEAMFVQWPPPADTNSLRQVCEAMPNAKDFFDRIDVLAVTTDAARSELYALVLMRRAGGTSLAREASQPWQLAIWRWKAATDGRIMLAGRGYFFRGILPPGRQPPPVFLVSGAAEAPATQEGSALFDGAAAAREPATALCEPRAAKTGAGMEQAR